MQYQRRRPKAWRMLKIGWCILSRLTVTLLTLRICFDYERSRSWHGGRRVNEGWGVLLTLSRHRLMLLLLDRQPAPSKVPAGCTGVFREQSYNNFNEAIINQDSDEEAKIRWRTFWTFACFGHEREARTNGRLRANNINATGHYCHPSWRFCRQHGSWWCIVRIWGRFRGACCSVRRLDHSLIWRYSIISSAMEREWVSVWRETFTYFAKYSQFL